MRTEIEQYKLTEAVSYSVLSALNQHPRNLLRTDQQKSTSLDIGSLVDCMMFTPEDLNEVFYFTDKSKPGEKLGDWLDAYLAIEIPPDYKLNDVRKLILRARDQIEYQSNWKEDTVMKKWDDEIVPYLEIIAKAGDKTVIGNTENQRAITMQSKLLNNQFTSKYFKKESKDYDLVFQVAIYYTVEGVACKSLLDGVFIDHVNKMLIPFDLKTTSDSVLHFENSFIKWNYYLQSAMYHHGLSITGLGSLGYTVANKFLFIVVNDFEEPLIWECDSKLLSIGKLGGITRSGQKLKGFLQLLEDYKWHKANDLYDYPASVYVNNGVKLLDII